MGENHLIAFVERIGKNHLITALVPPIEFTPKSKIGNSSTCSYSLLISLLFGEKLCQILCIVFKVFDRMAPEVKSFEL